MGKIKNNNKHIYSFKKFLLLADIPTSPLILILGLYFLYHFLIIIDNLFFILFFFTCLILPFNIQNKDSSSLDSIGLHL